MSRKIKLDCLDPASIEAAIDELKKLKAAFSDRALAMLVNELADLGCHYAQLRFSAAWYDGINDVSVEVLRNESTGDVASATVSATGEAVLFIELGTGITYPDNKNARSMITSGDIVGRGQYGKGHGKRHTWGFYLNGEDGDGELILTHGNPSNACMYDTRKYIEEHIVPVAKEVLKW